MSGRSFTFYLASRPIGDRPHGGGLEWLEFVPFDHSKPDRVKWRATFDQFDLSPKRAEPRGSCTEEVRRDALPT
jgi:hypothetical protein